MLLNIDVDKTQLTKILKYDKCDEKFDVGGNRHDTFINCHRWMKPVKVVLPKKVTFTTDINILV